MNQLTTAPGKTNKPKAKMTLAKDRGKWFFKRFSLT